MYYIYFMLHKQTKDHKNSSKKFCICVVYNNYDFFFFGKMWAAGQCDNEEVAREKFGHTSYNCSIIVVVTGIWNLPCPKKMECVIVMIWAVAKKTEKKKPRRMHRIHLCYIVYNYFVQCLLCMHLSWKVKRCDNRGFCSVSILFRFFS